MLWALLACRPGADTGQLDALPASIRLGPPAPTVGIYDVLALHEAIYVSNLHTAFVTLADPGTGAWSGVLDLREGGLEQARFPRLQSWDGRVWVSSSADGVILAYRDGAFDERLEISPDDQLLGADDQGLWVGREDGLWRWNGDWGQEVELDFRPAAADRQGADWLLLDAGAVAVQQVGSSNWRVRVDAPDLGDVELVQGRAYASSRGLGEVLELGPSGVLSRQAVGSDTFALSEHDGHLLVSNRQGAELPASGSYQGAPGTVLRLDLELEPVWELELDKTIHFLSKAPDGSWWTANEDALRLSQFDADLGEELLRGPTLGLTLDALSLYEGRIWAGSHLTDELWWLDLQSLEAGALPTCGWPFQLVAGEDQAFVPCQEDGRVGVLEGLEFVEEIQLVDTFHQDCLDGLCTGHSALVGGAWSEEHGLLLGDPRERRVLALDGREWSLEGQGERGLVQHLQVLEQGGEVYAYEPREGALHSLGSGQKQAIEAELAWPLQAGQQLWVGASGLDGAQLEAPVLAGSADWLVLLAEEELIVLEAGSLAEAGRLGLDQLPFPVDQVYGQSSPLVALIDGETLWLASVFRGWIAPLQLPDLALSEGLAVDLGPWSGQQAVR